MVKANFGVCAMTSESSPPFFLLVQSIVLTLFYIKLLTNTLTVCLTHILIPCNHYSIEFMAIHFSFCNTYKPVLTLKSNSQ